MSERQVGVKALIPNSIGQFLFLRRAEPFPEEDEQHWDIPGGRKFDVETNAEGLRRGVFEEARLWTYGPRRLTHQWIPGYGLDRYTYIASALPGLVTINSEHDQALYATLRFAKSNLNLNPHLRIVLEDNSALDKISKYLVRMEAARIDGRIRG